MKYISTRNKDIEVSSVEAIIKGISKDGGLFVPKELPKIENLEMILNMDYKELAYTIMSKFLVDFEPSVLKACIDRAYDHKFDTDIIAPIVEIEDAFILELFHGPTFAFKDMALSILPYLLKEALKIKHINKEIVILTATSGDTGKAALVGFANVPAVKIIVFYPENGVSEIQEKQMITQEGDNTFVVRIKGNFDDAQTGVKRLFNDKAFNHFLYEKGYILSSANSINIGRLIPQIVYYFYGYIMLVRQGKIKKGEKINISVPTGNFGNILAAYYAKEMGLPVNKLICASNENKILSDFLNTGIYDRRRDLIITSSPSMDILISSNLERLLFHLSGENDKLVASKMNRLAKEGFYEMDFIHKGFYGYYSTEQDVGNAINRVFKENNYLMDPHTAVAYSVYKKYQAEIKDHTKTIIVSTASPFKFANKVASSIGIDVAHKDAFSILEAFKDKTSSETIDRIKKLKDKKIMHTNSCNKEDMKAMVKFLLKLVK